MDVYVRRRIHGVRPPTGPREGPPVRSKHSLTWKPTVCVGGRFRLKACVLAAVGVDSHDLDAAAAARARLLAFLLFS